MEGMHRLRRLLGILSGVIVLALAGTAFAGEDDDEGSAPSVTSVAATEVTAGSALVRAYVDPQGLSTTYFFEYGPTTAYGVESAPASAGSSDSSTLVSTPVGALQPETTYHYRLVATNSRGTTRGADRVFTTLASTAEGGEAPTAGDGEAPPDRTGDSSETGTDTPAGPQLGSSVTLEPGKGVVRVRRPGSSSFVALRAGSDLPVGSEVDARGGSVALTSALPSGEIQTGRFGGGRFLIRQRQSGLVDLHLSGRYCTRPGARPGKGNGSPLASAARRRRSGRRLWGRDQGGRFRTHGRNSHATVRGTRWLVADRCHGTLTRVTEGSVVVRDTVRNKRVVLDAGERYVARPRRY